MSKHYQQGFIDGLRAYAYYEDGEQYVGTTGRTLKEAIEKIEQTWNYSPPPPLEAAEGSSQ